MSEKVLDLDLTNKLQDLNLNELKQLKARVDWLIKNHSENNTPIKVTDDITFIKSLLLQALSKHIAVVPLQQLQPKDKVNITLIDIIKQIKSIYENQNLQREDLSSLCQLIALAAINKTVQKKLPLYYTTVIYNMQYVEVLIDEAFPGYLINGLLKLIIQQRTKHNGI
jgi:hypothetical protein